MKKGSGLLGGQGTLPSMSSVTYSNNGSGSSIGGRLGKNPNRRYLCLIISFVILLSLSFIFIAWNILCDIDDTDSTLKLEMVDPASTDTGLNRSSRYDRLPRHTVEVYYEVLCPDSKYFILNQLIPAYKKFSKYIRPILVPYGKAFTKKTVDGGFKFECQHGEVECEGNMLHACAVQHISNEHLLISYIYCLMKSSSWKTSEFEKIGEKCANEYQVSWSVLKSCWKSESGSLLLKGHGDSTHALNPAVTFIPTIAVDQSQAYQKDILKDFKSYLCKRVLMKEKLPSCT